MAVFELKVVLYFTELELTMHNRYLSFYNSFMIFWPVLTKLDRLCIYSRYFGLFESMCGRKASAAFFSPAAQVEEWI